MDIKMKKIAIFDMDGVLIDSEPLHWDAYRVLMGKLRINIPEEELNGFVGKTAVVIWKSVKERYALEESLEELMQKKDAVFFESLKAVSLEPMKGVKDLLEELQRAGIVCTIASSSYRNIIDHILSELELESYFDYVISGDEVRNGKPDPEIFLKVAERYDAAPRECVVIEDSHNGVCAAKTAGMNCVGYMNQNSGNQDLAKADLLVDSFGSENIERIMKFFAQ